MPLAQKEAKKGTFMSVRKKSIADDTANYDEKKFAENIKRMFGRISKDYDFLNHLLSAGMDIRWRRKLVAGLGAAGIKKDAHMLDVAAGTCDLTLEILRRYPEATVIASDLSEDMLSVAKKKMAKKGFGDKTVRFERGDALELQYEDDTFDAVVCAFGIRNVLNREKAVSEMKRVAKPGSPVFILELSMPTAKIIGSVYGFYFAKIMPRIAGFISGDRAAYRYLFTSVMRFPPPEEFEAIMRNAGLTGVQHEKLTFGTAALYKGVKEEPAKERANREIGAKK
jgi:demethylmenaquinone methyltransferase/2-methoxy-6-polyprenyl-1,4-benzoquinol methylase